MPETTRRELDGRRRLSVWSAGCASGEEPYSIAIMLCELLGTGLSGWRIRIHASDLDERALEAARRGSYQAGGLQNLDESTISRASVIRVTVFSLTPTSGGWLPGIKKISGSRTPGCATILFCVAMF